MDASIEAKLAFDLAVLREHHARERSEKAQAEYNRAIEAAQLHLAELNAALETP